MRVMSIVMPVSLSLLAACSGLGDPGDLTGKTDGELSKAVCEGLSEQNCLTTQGCELVYPACPLCTGPQCPPCDPTPRCQEAQPPPTDPCKELDEKTCSSVPGCYPEYAVCDLACAPDSDGGCMPCPTIYMGCSGQNPPPPPPPQNTCEGLDEATCASRSDCYGIYYACPAVCEDDGNGGCKPCPLPPFECRPISPPPPSHCDGLSEQSCNQTSGCRGVYASAGTCPPCPPGAACSPCPPDDGVYSSCVQDFPSCGSGGGGGAIDAGSPTSP